MSETKNIDIKKIVTTDAINNFIKDAFNCGSYPGIKTNITINSLRRSLDGDTSDKNKTNYSSLDVFDKSDAWSVSRSDADNKIVTTFSLKNLANYIFGNTQNDYNAASYNTFRSDAFKNSLKNILSDSTLDDNIFATDDDISSALSQ